jgi:hypothetical protein
MDASLERPLTAMRSPSIEGEGKDGLTNGSGSSQGQGSPRSPPLKAATTSPIGRGDALFSGGSLAEYWVETRR